MTPPERAALEVVVPLRWDDGGPLEELADALAALTGTADVTVVDGSPEPAWQRHAEAFAPSVRHLRPEPWPGVNGKVAGVVTGVRAARHEAVVVADDDVRWRPDQLRRAAALLEDADLVVPANAFDELPWHARLDTARTLLNRAVHWDPPGTLVLRRSTLLRAGGYDGAAMFENLELVRTVVAAGGRVRVAPDLLVARRPPGTDHFWQQRVRQAYDDLAQPGRLAVEAALLPAAVAVLRARPRRWVAACAAAVLLAEVGRRRNGGRTAFAPSSALWAPAWLAERAVCVWLALGARARGGVRYRGARVRLAAHSTRELRRLVPQRQPLEPALGQDA